MRERLGWTAVGVVGAVALLKGLAGPALLFQAEIGISADEAAGSRAPRGNEQPCAACVTRSDPLLFS